MNANTMTQEEIRKAGLAALARELGPVGTARFLQLFETGHGDYTTERHSILPSRPVAELTGELQKQSS